MGAAPRRAAAGQGGQSSDPAGAPDVREHDPEALARVHEFLVSQGHRDEDLWNYSVEKCCFLAKLAEQRVVRTEARETLRMMRAIGTAVWGSEDQYSAMQTELVERAGLKIERPKAQRKEALARVAAAFRGLGGKVNRG